METRMTMPAITYPRPAIPAEGERRNTWDQISVASRFRRWLLESTVDRGWFGMTPLKAHVVICGYPRAGSTMLYLMVHNCVKGVRVFNKEVFALNAARYYWRNHEFMATKKPLDTFFVDEIREYYRHRAADSKFVVLLRDPRSVLTSVHEKRPNEYFVEIDFWKALHEHVTYLKQFNDIEFIDYSELVSNCGTTQDRLTNLIGWQVVRPFRDFHRVENHNLVTRATNGVRPLEESSLAKWRNPRHRNRIRDMLHEIPNFPELVVRDGYEQDDSWVRDYY